MLFFFIISGIFRNDIRIYPDDYLVKVRERKSYFDAVPIVQNTTVLTYKFSCGDSGDIDFEIAELLEDSFVFESLTKTGLPQCYGRQVSTFSI